MSPRIIKLLIGIVIIYGFGWFTHQRPSVNVPKYISFILGRRTNQLNPVGIALQILAMIYLLAALIGIFQSREDRINFYAVGAIFSACFIYLIITGVLAIKKRLKP